MISKRSPSQIWMMPGLTTDSLNNPAQRDGTARRAASASAEVARLVGVVAALREHCPWTAALTHASLSTYLLEESYELLQALESGPGQEIANELGDLLLQVVLHARLAEESGSFDLAEVARGLSAKLIRRSPHVFHADGTLQGRFPATIAEIEQTWERVKAEERAAASDAGGAAAGAPTAPSAAGTGIFSGIPRVLPALAMAQKTLERAERAALDTHTAQARGPGAENIGTEAQLGEVLFDVVRVAQQNGLDAERALRLAVLEFQRRPESA